MTLVATSRALVVVLGRGMKADGAAMVREAAALQVGLRLLVVGYPVTRRQHDVEESALAEADRLRTPLDVVLVLSAGALVEAVGSDGVRVVGSHAETRRIGRILRGGAGRTR